MLEELRGRKEETFIFGCQCSSSDVHFQSKPAKVVIYQFHAFLEVLSCAKWEGPVINIEALQYLICILNLRISVVFDVKVIYHL